MLNNTRKEKFIEVILPKISNTSQPCAHNFCLCNVESKLNEQMFKPTMQGGVFVKISANKLTIFRKK